ncbi:MAG: Na/Pi symporter [Polyangiaceae bacterium]|nr:Na/Pi symporter [Myxococcales bacterium]MCB9590069.1 Na/Pi symporter [Polyangiaceae bacterium]MCB9607948.1 Na/Pi symporter [Polyangiaceae bacterium]
MAISESRRAAEKPADRAPEHASEIGEVSAAPPPRKPTSRQEVLLRALLVFVLLYLFLVGIGGLSDGFKGLGKHALDSVFSATSNPFIALTIGILATTLVQSSSVTTSMVVALVAAPNSPLPLANAIPIIMGANIGTTVTNTLVSLGHAGRKDEFRRAFAAATCHDFFNFLAVAVLLPLELATGYLAKVSGLFVGLVGGGGGAKPPNPIKQAVHYGLEPLHKAIDALVPSQKVAAVVLLVVSAVLIFVSLFLLVKTLRALTGTRLQTYVARALDTNAYVGIIVGVLVTVMVQSSSITTSVMVPLAGAGIVTVRQVFPVTLGANIGTTITALLASMALPPETAQLGVQIALVHLLFNLTGLLMVYPLRFTREIPVRAAEKLADLAVRSRALAFGYVVVLFYGLPAGLIWVTRGF